MRQVAVLLDEIPQMLRSIILDTLAREADIHVVDADAPWHQGSDVDVILTSAVDPHDFDRASALLMKWPRSTIVIVSFCGREAVLYEWYPRKLVLGDVSPGALVNVVRHGFNQPC